MNKPQVPSGEGEAWQPIGTAPQNVGLLFGWKRDNFWSYTTGHREGTFILDDAGYEIWPSHWCLPPAPPGTVSTLPRQGIDVAGWRDGIEAVAKMLEDAADRLTSGRKRINQVDQHTADVLRSQAEKARALLARSDAAPDAVGETFETIAKWCEETFGPITPARIAERANEEMIELLADPSKVEEAADVVIVLSRYPGLWATVQRKMAVNRQRQWRLMGDGTGYHVKPALARAETSQGQGGKDNG